MKAVRRSSLFKFGHEHPAVLAEVSRDREIHNQAAAARRSMYLSIWACQSATLHAVKLPPLRQTDIVYMPK